MSLLYVKYYAEDTGLRNARLDFRDVEPSHSMENVIYNELVRRGCSVDVGVVRISGRDENGKQFLRQHEIDFVVNRAPGKIYIQSAWRMPSEEKRLQELLPLRRSGDFFKKITVRTKYWCGIGSVTIFGRGRGIGRRESSKHKTYSINRLNLIHVVSWGFAVDMGRGNVLQLCATAGSELDSSELAKEH